LLLLLRQKSSMKQQNGIASSRISIRPRAGVNSNVKSKLQNIRGLVFGVNRIILENFTTNEIFLFKTSEDYDSKRIQNARLLINRRNLIIALLCKGQTSTGTTVVITSLKDQIYRENSRF
jgi:hypothetical protein